VLRLLKIFCLLSIATIVVGQENESSNILESIKNESNDSLIGDYYYRLCKIYQGTDLQLAKSYADSGFQYFVKYGDAIRSKEKLYYDAVLSYGGGDLVTSKNQLIEYYNWADSINNNLRKAYATTLLTKVLRESGDLSMAIHYALEGLELNKTLNIVHDEGFYATELGNMYSTLQQWDISKQYFEQSYQVAKQIKFPIGEAVSLRNLAQLAIEVEDYSEAEKYLKEALQLDSLQKYDIGLVRSYRNLGLLFDKKGEEKKALEFYKKALSHLIKKDRSLDLAQVYQGIAKVLLAQGKYTNAKDYLILAKENGQESESLEFRVEQARLESEYYEEIGNQAKALKSAREHHDIHNQILDDKISNQIAGLNIKYETKQKELEISTLNEKNIIAARQNRNLLLGLGLFGFLTLILLSLYRKIQLQNGLINTALSEKEILLREIHHRVKNNLQFVSSLLSLQSRSLEENSSAQSALLEGQNRVMSMALIHQNLYQEDNLTGIEIKKYFEKLSSSLFESYNISPEKISLKLDIEDVNLDVDSVVPLGLVVNELISNALKHAFTEGVNGTVLVSLKEDNDLLILMVKDDGKGLDLTDKKALGKSFGYKLIHAFSSQLDAELILESDQGTSVKMLIKDYIKVA